MAEQRTLGNRHASKGELSEPVRRRPGPARDAPVAELETDGNGELPVREPQAGGGGERTVRAELASIVRESALEVLGPIARKATTRAAKYAVSKGPSLAK